MKIINCNIAAWSHCTLSVQMTRRWESRSTSHCSCLYSEYCWDEHTSVDSRSSSEDLLVQTPAAVRIRVLSTVCMTLSLALTTLPDHLRQRRASIYLRCIQHCLHVRRRWWILLMHMLQLDRCCSGNLLCTIMPSAIQNSSSNTSAVNWLSLLYRLFRRL